MQLLSNSKHNRYMKNQILWLQQSCWWIEMKMIEMKECAWFTSLKWTLWQEHYTRRQLACILDGMSLSVSWFVVIVVFHWYFELNRILTCLELDFFFRLCVCVCVCVCGVRVGGRERGGETERERADILYMADKVYLLCSPRTSQGWPPSTSDDGTDHSASSAQAHPARLKKINPYRKLWLLSAYYLLSALPSGSRAWFNKRIC